MTIKEAKEMDMVDYLSSLGHNPERISGHHYWYSSPLHDERTPSFKINRKMNKWKDWGTGESGNIIDFGIRFYQCNISDFLKKLDGPGQSVIRHKIESSRYSPEDDTKNRIKVTEVKNISSLPLFRYLQGRRIPTAIAARYLKEIVYELNDKKYYALGFKNDSGGYELRNEYIKAASSPKDSTFIDNGAKDVAVFEGFFNFLSYLVIHHNQPLPERNYLILNSTSFFEKELPKMIAHGHAFMYLDNDNTGNKFTQKALETDRQKFSDERPLYKKYDDLNHWLMQIKPPLQQRAQQNKL